MTDSAENGSTYSFVDAGTYTVTTRVFDGDDAVTDPLHSYADPGIFTVTLTVQNT